MTIKLPKPILNYFSADKRGSEAVAKCFTQNAVVNDEGCSYKGLIAIKQWKMDSSKKYTYTCDPLSLAEKEGKIIVTSQLAGNFPGSPIKLRYIFGIDGGKIAFMEIII